MARTLRSFLPILIIVIISANCGSKQDREVESTLKQLNETHEKLMDLVTEYGMADERTREMGVLYQAFQQKLIDLGYFEKRSYDLPGEMSTAEKSLETLGQIAAEHFPEAQLGTLTSLHDGRVLTIFLVDRPDNLKRWEQLMSEAGLLTGDQTQAESAAR